MKVYAYLRVSGRSQVEKDGFVRQKAAIGAWARARRATIENTFTEEGVTGEAEWSERPAFREMLAAILGNGVRTIVVENMTRLARSYVITDTILTYLAAKGITLISADTGENVTEAIQADPMRKALIQIQATFAELEKNTLVRKLAAARARKRAETGRCDGRKPFGHRPGEAATIARMAAWRATGRHSYRDIAGLADEAGLPTRSGGPWTAGAVHRILERQKAK